MGTLYIDGKANKADFFRVTQEFRTIFGGEVSSTAITIKNPDGIEPQEYFCIKIDAEEIESMDSFTKLKIDRVFKNLNASNLFKELQLLKATPDLDYIFSLNEKSSPKKDQTAIKDELKKLQAETDLATIETTTTAESSPSYPSFDELSDLSDDGYEPNGFSRS